MTDARIKAEQLAVERFGNPDAELLTPDESEIIQEQVYGFTTGYLAARTISAAELEAAAEAAYKEVHADSPEAFWRHETPHMKSAYRKLARAAFRAAGFIVESGE